jgi:hypothetical protein
MLFFVMFLQYFSEVVAFFFFRKPGGEAPTLIFINQNATCRVQREKKGKGKRKREEE